MRHILKVLHVQHFPIFCNGHYVALAKKKKTNIIKSIIETCVYTVFYKFTALYVLCTYRCREAECSKFIFKEIMAHRIIICFK